MFFSQVKSNLRKLAKSTYWQSIYSNSKECGSISMFRNDTDLTDIQILFLNDLSFYHSIYLDISMGEVPELVLDNEIYEDAYIAYKNDNRMNKTNNTKKENNVDQKNLKSIEKFSDKDEFIFRRPLR